MGSLGSLLYKDASIKYAKEEIKPKEVLVSIDTVFLRTKDRSFALTHQKMELFR